MPKYDVISFLSDMGTIDESVGVCKAIMYQQAPHVNIFDITHDVPAFDVRAGALALTRAIQFLPKGVVVAAVDPGSPRGQRYIVVELEEGVLIGPDNGILAPAAQLIGQPKRVFEITNLEFRIDAPGEVFAARDILAPAAGVIAAGTDISQLGNEIPLEQLVPGMLQLSRHDEGGALLGEVWSVDRFGNVQLNITPEELESRNVRVGDAISIRVGDKDYMAKYVERYADLAISQVGILVDSTGMISVVKNLDYATVELGTREGKEIILLPQGATVTGRDVTMESVAMAAPPNASIEDAAQNLMQGLAQTQSVDAPPSYPSAGQPEAAQGYPTQPDPSQGMPSSPAAQTPFGTLPPQAPPASDPFPYTQPAPPAAPSTIQPGSDPFATQANSEQPSTSQYLSQPPASTTGPVPGADPFASFTQPPAQPAPPVPQAPAPQPDFPADAPQAPQWGVPAQPPVQPAPVADTPASYFPPPVEEQPNITAPDVAPTYEQPQSPAPVAPEGVPENVFDLFKVVQDDEYTDPDSEDSPQN